MSGQFEYDLVTLGAGSGGVRASRFAAQLYGAKVAVVELPFGFVPSDTVGGAGGTCVIRGCVPKKLLVYGAQFSEDFVDSAGFGWRVDNAIHDWSKLMSHKAKEIQRLNQTYGNILKSAGVECIEGRGVVVDPHTIEVQLSTGGTRRLTTKNILVATGGYASKIPIEGSEYAITSDEALALESLPPAPIAVIGAGYIACEFAGIFRGVGSEVHLLFRSNKVLRSFDEECRSQVMENLEKRVIKLHPGSTPTKITKDGDGYVLHYQAEGSGKQQLRVGLIMMATGRKPRSRHIGLEAAGVEIGKDDAVKVDICSRTSVPSIWAIGDVTNRINLTPVALMEGMAFAKACFGDDPNAAPSYDWVPSAVFCSPPLGTVGYTEEMVQQELCGEYDVYVSKFRPMKYTISGRDEKTLMKLIVSKETDRVVGVHMVGPDAPEIIQGMAIALKCGATKRHFDSTVGIHPSAAEEFVTMRSKTRTIVGNGSCKL